MDILESKFENIIEFVEKEKYGWGSDIFYGPPTYGVG